MQIHTETKQLVKPDYAIHYYCSGQPDNPLVMFLHPAFGDHRCFDSQIEAFSEHYRVITLDMLGHGRSQLSGGKEKMDVTIEHIREIMDIEGYNSSHFVGVSMGSLVAQYYAIRYPDRVNSLTAVGGYDIHGNNREIVKTQHLEIVKWLVLITFSMKKFRRYLASLTVVLPEQQMKFYEMASLFSRRSMRVMSGIQSFLQQREGYRFSKPLLLLCGEHDLDLAKRASAMWHAKEAQARYDIIPAAGHCANMDHPERFNTVVLNFLAGLTTLEDETSMGSRC